MRRSGISPEQRRLLYGLLIVLLLVVVALNVVLFRWSRTPTSPTPTPT